MGRGQCEGLRGSGRCAAVNSNLSAYGNGNPCDVGQGLCPCLQQSNQHKRPACEAGAAIYDDCCSEYCRAAPWGRRGKDCGRWNSACGRETGYFALRGELLCPRRQSNQNAAGDVGQRKHEKFLPLEIFPRFHASFPRTPVTGTHFCFVAVSSGAHSPVLLPLLPGLRPWVEETWIGTAAESCA